MARFCTQFPCRLIRREWIVQCTIHVYNIVHVKSFSCPGCTTQDIPPLGTGTVYNVHIFKMCTIGDFTALVMCVASARYRTQSPESILEPFSGWTTHANCFQLFCPQTLLWILVQSNQMSKESKDDQNLFTTFWLLVKAGTVFPNCCIKTFPNHTNQSEPIVYNPIPDQMNLNQSFENTDA